MGLVVNGAIHHTDRVGCLVTCALGHVRLHYTGGFLFDCYSTRVTTSAKCCIDSSAGTSMYWCCLRSACKIMDPDTYNRDSCLYSGGEFYNA